MHRVSSAKAADLRRFLSRHTKTNGIDADTLARLPIFDPDGLQPLVLPGVEQAALDRRVRATDRLVDSAVVLAAPEGGPDLQMQRLLRRAGRGFGAGLPVLEINPRHGLVRKLAGMEGELKAEAGTLLDLARLQDGDVPRDPAGFARQVADRVVFMDRGEVVEQGPPNTLFENPQTDRLKLFLSQILRGH